MTTTPVNDSAWCSGMGMPDPANICSVEETRKRLIAGEQVSDIQVLQATSELFRQSPVSLVPLMGILTLKGEPLSLAQHFPFEPLYNVRVPKQVVLKCARQVSKSTSLAANGILRCASHPHLRKLFVTPRYEQVRRLSTNYVRPFIKESLIKSMLVDESCTQAVLQRSFINGSEMYFSFAFLDCDRVRGIPCDWINYDEIQDMDYDFIPVIQECMSASPLGVSFYSGTPKTLDNGIEALWEASSKAEWVIPCFSCGHWNMACMQADMMKMIGREGVVCSKCQNLINPAAGHWYHTEGQHHSNFHGYHVPQIIMPMHYSDKEKWGELLDKRDGKGNYNQQRFMNEVLGESADMGVKLVTITDIVQASQLGKNDYEKAIDNFRKCKVRVLAVDWGGGGAEEVSYTTCALVGLNIMTGKVECHYAHRFHAGHTHDEEARALLTYFREASCHFFAHDFGGSGSVRETLMIQAGLPLDRILGFMYVRASTRNIVNYNSPPQGEMRGYYALDKARSLVLQAICLKKGAIILPEYESSKNITHDLLALREDKHEMPHGADVYLVRRSPKLSDDFAHALNFGSMCIWHTEQNYPDLSLLGAIKLSEEQMTMSSPPNPFKESPLGR